MILPIYCHKICELQNKDWWVSWIETHFHNSSMKNWSIIWIFAFVQWKVYIQLGMHKCDIHTQGTTHQVYRDVNSEFNLLITIKKPKNAVTSRCHYLHLLNTLS